IILDSHDANANTPCYLKDLSVPCRVILLLITHTFLPRTGTHTFISKIDLRLMACIKNGEPVNLPHLIINHMLNTPITLPYSVIVNRILLSSSMDLSGEPFELVSVHSRINSVTLLKGKYVLIDDNWYKPDEAARIHG
ncbi:hypothetical protein CFOL_v3_21281, partial [Cephalotus follicularis]